jgi:DNA-binding XRE family transcriptional regulator
MSRPSHVSDYQINKNLKKYCKKHLKLTQDEVAERVGTIRHSIGAIFRERNEPICRILQGFAEGFEDLNMNWVFRGEGEMEIVDEDTKAGLIQKVRHLEAMLEEKERAIADKERYIKLLEKQVPEINK